MARILSTDSLTTVNVTPGDTVDVSEGWALNLSSGALGDTTHAVAGTANAVPVGVVLTPLTDGAPQYGLSTGQAVEVAVGNTLVWVESADCSDSVTFNDTNYAVGEPVGFEDGQYVAGTSIASPSETISARGVVVGNVSVGSTFTAAIVLVNAVRK